MTLIGLGDCLNVELREKGTTSRTSYFFVFCNWVNLVSYSKIGNLGGDQLGCTFQKGSSQDDIELSEPQGSSCVVVLIFVETLEAVGLDVEPDSLCNSFWS